MSAPTTEAGFCGDCGSALEYDTCLLCMGYDAPCSAPTPDPRDARIAALEAQVATVRAALRGVVNGLPTTRAWTPAECHAHGVLCALDAAADEERT